MAEVRGFTEIFGKDAANRPALRRRLPAHTMSTGDSAESSTSTHRTDVTIPRHKVSANLLALVSA
jgi:hypothetical protein